jgi:hypothetical protein
MVGLRWHTGSDVASGQDTPLHDEGRGRHDCLVLDDNSVISHRFEVVEEVYDSNKKQKQYLSVPDKAAVLLITPPPSKVRRRGTRSW